MLRPCDANSDAGDSAPSRPWTVVDDDLLILDDARAQVYRLSGESARDALPLLNTSQNRRRFIQSLAAGAVAGVAVIALPSAAAAASPGDSGDSPAGAEPDAEPSANPEEQDSNLSVTGTTAGDGTVTITWEDTSGT